MAAPTYTAAKKLSSAKMSEYSIVDTYQLGYRNREDITNLPPGVLIVGSKNVVTNVSERIQIRQGYSVDGQVSTVEAPVLSSFDWLTRGNGEVHLRAGGLTEDSLGAEMVTNPTFAVSFTGWTDTTGWTYSPNTAVYDQMTVANALNSNALSITEGTRYQIEVHLTGTTGTVSFQLFPVYNEVPVEIDATAGTFIVVSPPAELTSASYSINFQASSDFDGTVTLVSVKEAADGLLQYRYVDDDGDVEWRDLLAGLSTVRINFSKFWSTAESLREVLFVDGSSNIYKWNGATAVIASTSSATITKTGTDTWLDSGFYTAADKFVVIDGITFSYTGGEDTTTLTGVSPDPTGAPNGSIVHQAVVTTPNTDMTGLPDTFPNSLIGTLNNQVFIGSTISSAVYISNVNSYTDYSSSTPRESGEGATLILDDNCVAFEPQENYMYISCGQDLWYNVNFEIQTSTVGITYEQVNALPLKTGRQQAALSQAFVSHMKNNIIVVTNEPTIDTFGRVENIQATPQQTNLSDPIKLDVDTYDFTDGSIAYWRYYILVAVPKEGLVLLYNLATNGWEAPQSLPISRFYIVEGELYGHSYNSFESYQLFTGYADRVYPGFAGSPIEAIWKFSYQNYGSRFGLKKATKAYVEGYINANTTLTFTLTYELDGCQTVKTFQLDGSNGQFVCIATASNSLGKTSLGKQKLGGDMSNSVNNLPPKFRWFPTFTNTDFFEVSFGFSVLGTDERAELLAFGLATGGSTQIPVQKMD